LRLCDEVTHHARSEPGDDPPPARGAQPYRAPRRDVGDASAQTAVRERCVTHVTRQLTGWSDKMWGMAAGTSRPTHPPVAADAVAYDDLYARWERGHWRATEIDFTRDRVDWHERLTPEQRRGALWLYALFFHGEDSVTDDLSPYIDAAPREEQKYFLATQQADEARHSVFFKRFLHEVVGRGDGSVAGVLAATRSELTWGHRQVFARLDRMAEELRADRSPRKLAAAVTLYHVVVEASLAQPGQHMIEDYLGRYDILPGFRAGMRHVSLDEQRHIGFGVKLLADLHRQAPEETTAAIVGVIREVLPWTIAVAKPPNWDRSYTECFGFTLEDLGEAGAASLEQRLRAIGLPVLDLPRFPMPMDIPPRERALRGQTLLRANLIGPGDGPASQDPEAVAILFDTLARQADASRVPAGTTIVWDFEDAPPWHIVLDERGSTAAAGRAPRPDVTLRCRFADWADVAAGRADPRALMLNRRLRPRGSLRVLWALPRVMA
jgi:ribonucleotide reductase beta subunit family protein with ferritin-like domain